LNIEYNPEKYEFEDGTALFSALEAREGFIYFTLQPSLIKRVEKLCGFQRLRGSNR
jgi:hypothetical protein